MEELTVINYFVQNGLLSSIPYIAMFTWAQLYGLTIDRLITKRRISVTSARKVSNTVGELLGVQIVRLSYLVKYMRTLL
jgi:hypothetical protein